MIITQKINMKILFKTNTKTNLNYVNYYIFNNLVPHYKFKNFFMKKIITILTASVLFVTLLTFGSCKKDDNGNSCTELANAASTAAMNYSSNPDSENCQAYKVAITNYVDGCAVIEQSVKEQYLAALEGLNCNGK
ncbi:MAG: hypothetical protein C0595_02940 [Marinilabiliales bacterium]|nr:MAG: hypothetical protein C0595_02940 [Marinilabiliales bacterium]